MAFYVLMCRGETLLTHSLIGLIFFVLKKWRALNPLMSSPHATAVTVVTVSSYNNGMRLVL